MSRPVASSGGRSEGVPGGGAAMHHCFVLHYNYSLLALVVGGPVCSCSVYARHALKDFISRLVSYSVLQLCMYSVNSTFGQRSFKFQGASLWNELPKSIKDIKSLKKFEALKLHLLNLL